MSTLEGQSPRIALPPGAPDTLAELRADAAKCETVFVTAARWSKITAALQVGSAILGAHDLGKVTPDTITAGRELFTAALTP